MNRLILYDLDGTLVDTKEDIAQAANHMLTQMGQAPLPGPVIWRFVGLGLRQLVEGCLQTDDSHHIEQGMKLYRAHYTQHLLDHTQLFPRAIEVLEHFKARKQAVITNKPNPYARDILTGLRVADYFSEIVGGNSEYPKKPDPGAALAIMHQEGVPHEQTLLIGDSPIDVEMGRSAGIFTVGVSHGFSTQEELAAAAPDLIVKDFAELLVRAQTLNW